MPRNSEDIMEDMKKSPVADGSYESRVTVSVETVPHNRTSCDYDEPEFSCSFVEVKQEDLHDVKREPADEHEIERPNFATKPDLSSCVETAAEGTSHLSHDVLLDKPDLNCVKNEVSAQANTGACICQSYANENTDEDLPQHFDDDSTTLPYTSLSTTEPVDLTVNTANKCDTTEDCNRYYTHPNGTGISDARVKTIKRGFACDVCDKKFTKSCNLKSHARIHTGERPFSCTVCSKTFITASNFKTHMRVHTGERPFSCEVCEKTFTESSQLKIHRRMHTSERPFGCEVCGKKFVQPQHLKSHMKVHSEERLLSCEVCGKNFLHSLSFKRHVQSHSAGPEPRAVERRFNCEVCAADFTRKEHLKRHMRVHTGEQPFVCYICNKCFAEKHHLQIHLRVHTGERPFQCDACGGKFSNVTNLKAHKNRHAGERRFSCEVCSRKFTTSSHLKRHFHIHADLSATKSLPPSLS